MPYSLFRKRTGVKGNNAYDRAFFEKKRSFDSWFKNTLNRASVTVDGEPVDIAIQDQNQNNNKDLSDDKYIVSELSAKIDVGSIMHWRDAIWMVFSKEFKTIETHKQFKIKASNHVMKWMVGKDVCNNGNGFDAFIQNQTLYTLGVSTSGSHSWVVNAKMMMYMPNTKETSEIRIGQRVFIGSAVYQVMFKDTVSRKGLINYLLEQDFVNPLKDNVELGIADYYASVDNDNVGEDGNGNQEEIVINGKSSAKIGSAVTFTTESSIVEWMIVDTENVSEIINQTENELTVRIEKNFKKVGSIINLVAKSDNGAVGSKTISIVSPY